MEGAIRRAQVFSEEERLLILKSCLVAGGLVKDRVPDTPAIRARLQRAKQSIRQHADEYGWEE